jgi:hypothetical protein
VEGVAAVIVPIKRGTARRLGLKLPPVKAFSLGGDAFRGVASNTGEYWLWMGNLVTPVTFTDIAGDGAGGAVATGHLGHISRDRSLADFFAGQRGPGGGL